MIDKIQQKVQHVTTVTAPTGGGMAITGAFTFNEWLAIGGFLLALGSFCLNLYYQRRRDRREEELLRHKISQ